MTRLLSILSAITLIFAMLCALPGLPLLWLSAWLQGRAVARDLAAHDHALDLEVQ